MKALAFSFLLSFSVQAVAADQITGVWSTKSGCDRLEAIKKDSKAAWQGNFMEDSYLSKDGLDGYEWQCRFLHGYTGPNEEIVQVSSCTVEGDSWPDLIMLQSLDETGWAVTVKGPAGEVMRSTYDKQCVDR